MEEKIKIYTVAVAYKRRVKARDDGDAVREVTYAVSAQEGTTHLEVRVLGARDIEPAPVPIEAHAPAAEALPQPTEDLPL